MRIFPQRSALILPLVASALALSAGFAQSQTARTIRFETATGQATVAVLLPAEYDSTTLRYPVLYLLHGGTQNHTAFPARNWFTREASGRRMIVVMPHRSRSSSRLAAMNRLPWKISSGASCPHTSTRTTGR